MFSIFRSGGVIFIYRDWLCEHVRKHRLVSLVLVLTLSCAYYLIDGIGTGGWIEVIKNFSMMILFSSWLVYAIGSNGIILNNFFTSFISSISMEIYLCHMVIFRALQKVDIYEHLSNGFIGYLISSLAVFCGAIILSVGFKKGQKALLFAIKEQLVKFRK